ncbi:MAG: MarR family winged helix-turn-helix transcriptional regulator [Actinobacteria bacterium]|nr:MarR family winged helix-turn-helix transcriptional regulator [Actinomycetota bacterium]
MKTKTATPSRRPKGARIDERAVYQANMARLLLAAFRWFEDGLFYVLDEAGWPGIRRPHSAVFGHLDKEGTRESELARRIGVTRQSVHQTVMELRDMGLVELVTDPSNASAKLVVVTPLGRKQSRVALKAFADLEAELARRIGKARVRELRRILELEWDLPVGKRTTSAHLKRT